jgi:signal transduction histidine kinase
VSIHPSVPGDSTFPAETFGSVERTLGSPRALAAYADYPPRVRLEWLLATTRIVLVAGALLALTLDRQRTPFYPLVRYLLAMYLGYSAATLVLVWIPLRFARGWAILQHATDLVVFSAVTLLTAGANSPFYVYFVFLMICATLRWQFRGALWTGVASIALYAALSAYAARYVGLPFALDAFVPRTINLAAVAVLLGYLGVYHQRFQQEVSALASWPRKVPDSPDQLIHEVLTESARICEAPRVLLVWEEPGEGHTNLASMKDGSITWSREREGTYGSLVSRRYQPSTFQTADAADDRGRVIYRHEGAFRQSQTRPVTEALRVRFDMRAVQSWPLDGELVRGRLFCLDKPQMRLDDLVVGELVARLAVSRLDSLYLLRNLRRAAALDERVRVARDLHDSVLQSLAGTALQLMAVRRLLDRDRGAAAIQLDKIQQQIENGELEMRSFIRRLRPESSIAVEATRAGLRERLQEVSRRVEQQWDVRVNLNIGTSTEKWPSTVTDEVFQIIRESMLNAARHADPSVISVDLLLDGARIRVRIADDGSGFPFKGSYDLQDLNAMDKGPWSLKERVAALHGKLTLNTSDAGSDLTIVLPLEG